ncbi:MAG: phosphate ABC transporter permease subunit PstC [Caldisericia bacterium]|nr:phosphate ABC transporter permease subunit PstC [Caldisericia bacterium]
MSKKNIEITVRCLLFLCSIISLMILVGIGYFLFKNGFSAFIENGLGNFIFGKTWNISKNVYGVYPLILGSLFVTTGSIIVSAPIGISVAIFMTDIATSDIKKIIGPCIELMAGIPSIVFGLVGMIFLVPLIRENFSPPGYSLIAAIIVLIVMTMPTIITLSEDSLRSVPRQYKEASYALGATKWQTVWNVTLPAAKSGIIGAVILGMGRAIGEAMAVYMVIGNAFKIPNSLFDPSRTLTSNIVGQIEEAALNSQHMHALFACGIILLIFVFLFNGISFKMRKVV